jgi:hypothetical protein
VNVNGLTASLFTDGQLTGTVGVVGDKGSFSKSLITNPASGISFRAQLYDGEVLVATSAVVNVYVPAPPPAPIIPSQPVTTTQPPTFNVGDSMNLVIGKKLF